MRWKMRLVMRAALCVLLLTWAIGGRAEPAVRVRLFGNQAIRQCAISSLTSMNLADESGSVRAIVAPGHEVMVSVGGGRLVAQRGRTRFTANLIRASSEGGAVTVMGRPYRGGISLRSLDGKVVIINSLPLEDYLRAVVPCEMPTTFHPEALKAQAIVSRTIALRSLEKHSAEGADFCDLTHCQVYQGAKQESPRANEAVETTRGLVLTHEGKPASLAYHSTCGGHTADANSVWPGPACPPSLVGRPDTLNGKAACAQSPHFRWEARVSKDELDSAFDVDDAGVRVVETDSAGRAAAVQIQWPFRTPRRGVLQGPSSRGRVPEGPGGSKRMTGEQFHLALGRKLGWGRLKSARFTVRPVPGGWLFEGRGLGHGVGMCQWGANARARAGHTKPQILSHYFPATRLADRRNQPARP